MSRFIAGDRDLRLCLDRSNEIPRKSTLIKKVLHLGNTWSFLQQSMGGRVEYPITSVWLFGSFPVYANLHSLKGRLRNFPTGLRCLNVPLFTELNFHCGHVTLWQNFACSIRCVNFCYLPPRSNIYLVRFSIGKYMDFALFLTFAIDHEI